MKKIESIEQYLQLIEPKLKINASDWTKEEKEAIAKAYFEITKVSTGKGRNLDTGCTSCVSTAVTIIKNYLVASFDFVPAKEEGEEDKRKQKKKLIGPSNDNWKKNVTSVDAAAKEMSFDFPETAKSKNQKIIALEKHIKELNS